MRNVRHALEGIIFAVLFFWTPFINLVLWVLLLILGCVYFISNHLREQRDYPGKWIMHWDVFWQNLLVGGLILLCFTLYIFRGYERLLVIMVGMLLGAMLYAVLMALNKEA
jgi:hypothetical protein